MKKSGYMILLLLSLALYGCSGQEKSGEAQTKDEIRDMAEEDGMGTKDDGENDSRPNSADSESVAADGQSQPPDSQPASEKARPTKEEVLAAREQVLEGMSEEEAERLKENVKAANLQMEAAYLYKDIFGKLEDPENLYWNYFDEKGEIQIGWGYDGNLKMEEIMEKENLSQEEFYSQYAIPVTHYNHFNGEDFVELFEEMKETVKDEKLRDDLQQLIDETTLAVQTHEMEHAYRIYQLLHDMDYYLLRYGPEDVGKYVRDTSLISKYYGVLSVYE